MLPHLGKDSKLYCFLDILVGNERPAEADGVGVYPQLTGRLLPNKNNK